MYGGSWNEGVNGTARHYEGSEATRQRERASGEGRKCRCIQCLSGFIQLDALEVFHIYKTVEEGNDP